MTLDRSQLVTDLQMWGADLGFSAIGVASVDLPGASDGLRAWLDAGFHGDMDYMASHGSKRSAPTELVPGTVSIITARMDYLPQGGAPQWREAEAARLKRPDEGIISVYARGRDYHKVLRQRLARLANRLQEVVGPFGHRAFTDSAPVMEVELASRSGLGWRGKHTLLLSREAGSMFFLGEIFVDIELPATPSVDAHCGNCSACQQACPTQAFIGPYRLDARRCISYLTIEHRGSIPVELRPLMGNRVYGCDDCQRVCPWNKFARRASIPDFDERPGMSGESLTTLFSWSEAEFLRRTEGSAIRRIGHERWLRNVAVALGNALAREERAPRAARMREALATRLAHPSTLVREHVQWALIQAREKDSPEQEEKLA